MSSPRLTRSLIVLSLVLAALTLPPCSDAISILAGPTFAPSTQAPLAGLLQLTTDVDSRISVVVSDGSDFWERDFYDFATTHSLPLVGFKASRTNEIQVTAYDKHRNACTAASLITFVTPPLPSDFPHSVVLKSEPDKMEPGYTLFLIQYAFGLRTYITIMDQSGDVVWYRHTPYPTDSDVRQMPNGHLLIQEEPPPNDILEMDMLGNIVRVWKMPAGYPIRPHDAVITPHGTILYVGDVARVVSNFPSILPRNSTNPNPPLVTATVDDTPVVEISYADGSLLNAWSPVDMLDPTRVSYLTGDFGTSFGVDAMHGNAVIEDPSDNSIIESLRDQNAVFKFSRAGQLKWILGPHENWPTNFDPYLLTPVGTPFEWNYGQHAPELTPDHTVMLYDDGNFRASPFDPPLADPDTYSRAVEFSIDETNMQVSQVWDTTLADEDRFFTRILGDADWLPQRRNVLVTYGYITYVNGAPPSAIAANAAMVRIVEYTHDPIPEVVFDLSFFDYDNVSSSYRGYFCYRSDRIPDLYVHPAQPVADLEVTEKNQTPELEFSADPVHTYAIQASTDLKNWKNVGAPVEGGSPGDFNFSDLNANQFVTRFYRIVTQ